MDLASEVQRVCNLTREFTRLYWLHTEFFLVKRAQRTHERTREHKKQAKTKKSNSTMNPAPLLLASGGFASYTKATIAAALTPTKRASYCADRWSR